MKVITWNVAGRVGKFSKQIKALNIQQPDVVTLQEVTKTKLPLFKEKLPDLGLHHIVSSFDYVKDSLCLKGPRRYGLLIGSKYPISKAWIGGENIKWPERFLSASLVVGKNIFEIHTTHIPPGSSNGWTKVEMLEGIFQSLTSGVHPMRILTGDFNTTQEEYSNGEIITWAYTKNSVEKYVLNRLGKRWDDAERNIILGLGDYDLDDVYRKLNGYSKKDYSWLLKRKDKTWERRFDHVFASSKLNATHAQYLHQVREEKISDHAMLEVIFEPK